ncbi:MAG: NAD(P)/FAD-dependent oxidoreductase [Proteobacteria bacterium]|nr:NAD(P)/FAD-dependent oxidoreductase [Pseudomonadota bacterium]
MAVIARRRFLLGAAAVSWSAAFRARAAAAAQLVVVGAGFAGSGCALALKRRLPGARVRLIESRSRYYTCPMSNEALVGMRNLASLRIARGHLAAAGVEYLDAEVAAIDVVRREVRLEGKGTLGYDRLVVAPGIRFLGSALQGYDAYAAQSMPHAWEAGVQTQQLAQDLAALGNGATVAISVPQGLMRCPPGPYERASLFAWYLSRRRRRCKVLIFDANNHFPRQSEFVQAWSELYPGMIEWIAPQDGGAVTGVDARRGRLFTSSGTHRVALANLIPPQAPGSIAAATGLSTGHGWCPVDPTTFASESHANVHVIGDACIAGAMPKSASAAASQAAQCAAAIAAALTDREPPAADLTSVCFSRLGPERALAIHGRFTVSAGALVSTPATTAASEDSDPASAAAWYRSIRSECFAD